MSIYQLHTYFNMKPLHNECVINNARVDYDACSTGSKKEADEFYGKNFDYMGSGFTTYHNGTKNDWTEEHHFYKLKPINKT